MAGAWNIPVLAFSTTSYALTNLDGAPPNTFFRLCQSDITTAIATYRAMQNLGLRMFNIMYVHDSFGRTFFEILDGFADQCVCLLTLCMYVYRYVWVLACVCCVLFAAM